MSSLPCAAACDGPSVGVRAAPRYFGFKLFFGRPELRECRPGTPDRREVGMSASETGTVRPGFSVGSTSEFSLCFHVKPGEGESLTAAFRVLHETSGYRHVD